MPVSSGLQKYFDSQQKKRAAQDIKKRFADLQWKIDPAFVQSFENFHNQIMEIIDENPHSSDVILDEVEELSKQVERKQWSYDIKKAAAIIHATKDC